jgi:hypothetical protein
MIRSMRFPARIMSMSALDDIAEVISRARLVAMEYYRLTGKPLGITGEIGEYAGRNSPGLLGTGNGAANNCSRCCALADRIDRRRGTPWTLAV